MPLKLYDSKDTVPEELRDSAIETKDGKFAVVEDDDAASQALTAERTKREAAERTAKKAGDELKKLQSKQKAENAGLTEEQLQQLRADARKEFEEEHADKLAAAESLAKELRGLKLDNAVKRMAGEAGFLAAKLDDLWKLHGDEFDLTDDGKPMVKGKPGVDPKKHIEALKKQRSEWVEGTKASGGGAGGPTNAGGGTVAASADDILKNPGAALAAARQAGKTE